MQMRTAYDSMDRPIDRPVDRRRYEYRKPASYMTSGRFILGVAALLVLVAGIKMYPDFERYMKIRSM
jgi:hypothetical protein